MDDECHESRDRSGASFKRDPWVRDIPMVREIPVVSDIPSALRNIKKKNRRQEEK